MYKPLHRVNLTNTQNRTGEHFPIPEMKEEVKRVQVEFEIWEQQVRQDARYEAGKKGGPLVLGSIEAQLRKISEDVTREAQEKNKRLSLIEKSGE